MKSPVEALNTVPIITSSFQTALTVAFDKNTLERRHLAKTIVLWPSVGTVVVFAPDLRWSALHRRLGRVGLLPHSRLSMPQSVVLSPLSVCLFSSNQEPTNHAVSSFLAASYLLATQPVLRPTTPLSFQC